MIHEVPELRILDDELWQSVKRRQTEIRERRAGVSENGLNAIRRNRHLFSGLIKCAKCGGGYSLISKTKYGCSTAKNKGTCTNAARVTRQELETRVLDALRGNLMSPDLFKEFCDEYTREINRLRIEASSELIGQRAELKRVETQIEKMIQAIMDGFYSPSMKEKMPVLEERKVELVQILETAEEPPVLLHPNMALEYRKRIDGLFTALQDKQTQMEASEDIRALIGHIVVSSGEGDIAELWLEGDLAGILTLAAGRKTPTNTEEKRVLSTLTKKNNGSKNKKSSPNEAANHEINTTSRSMVAGARTPSALLIHAFDIN